MKIFTEPQTQQEFYTLPNPWQSPEGAPVCGLSETNCAAFGWTIEVRPDPEPVAPPLRYSKRKIIEMLGDDWPKYRNQIQAAPNFAWDKWGAAQYLQEGDPDYEAFIATVPPEVVAKLDQCIYEED